jgi:hypothetical protein
MWALSIANPKRSKFRIIMAGISSYILGYLMYALFIGFSAAAFALFKNYGG